MVFKARNCDICDIIYDQTFNNSSHRKLETIQHNGKLVITGTIRDSSKEIIYWEVSLETLQQTTWFRKLCCMFKKLRNQFLRYLFNKYPPPPPLPSSENRSHSLTNSSNLAIFKVKHGMIFFLHQ